MAFAGIIWALVYFVFVASISIYAKLSTWNHCHPEIPKKIFFIFSDASDYDLGMFFWFVYYYLCCGYNVCF